VARTKDKYIKGKVTAVCTSAKKGTRKKNVGEALLLPDWGIEDDAHTGAGNRQVSLLAQESIDKMIEKGFKVGPGDFAENITTKGIELFSLPLGTRLKIGSEVIGEVSQIGKECVKPCAIYYLAGDCIMPKEGIFIRVIKGGKVKVADTIEVIK
jgi:MOSC domain-containing protein YiiM